MSAPIEIAEALSAIDSATAMLLETLKRICPIDSVVTFKPTAGGQEKHGVVIGYKARQGRAYIRIHDTKTAHRGFIDAKRVVE